MLGKNRQQEGRFWRANVASSSLGSEGISTQYTSPTPSSQWQSKDGKSSNQSSLCWTEQRTAGSQSKSSKWMEIPAILTAERSNHRTTSSLSLVCTTTSLPKCRPSWIMDHSAQVISTKYIHMQRHFMCGISWFILAPMFIRLSFGSWAAHGWFLFYPVGSAQIAW